MDFELVWNAQLFAEEHNSLGLRDAHVVDFENHDCELFGCLLVESISLQKKVVMWFGTE